MRRKQKNVLIIMVIIGIIIPSSLIINHFTILTRIYYKVNYKINNQSFENIIEKSELFDYLKYCKYRGLDKRGEIQNLSRSDSYYHIDRVFLESIKMEIEEDKKKFQIFPFHELYLIYSLEVSNESLIYLTYNNNSIIKAEHADHTDIFTARWVRWEDNPPNWIGNWYLNFTQIPFALNDSSTIMLSNIFLVKMNLIFHDVFNYWTASFLTIEQYLFFNSDFQVMLVYFPIESKAIP
ncbi:hypothetical protein LCGC14_2075150 [marine sediment metagenome]|uniref:Uncharacterized protein n=1 Tax=marine sediment metagenome TaxID=412755 RepID=A0A0F9GVK3_9ZZZZ